MEQRKFDKPIIMLSGVGKSTASKLSKLGVYTIGDLINVFPRSYEYRGSITPISNAIYEAKSSFLLTVTSQVITHKTKNGLTVSKFNACDDSGDCEIVFFNSTYVQNVFFIGTKFRFYGKTTLVHGKMQLQNPNYESYIDGCVLPDFIPIYSLTSGLTSKQIDKLMKSAMTELLPYLKDPLPEDIRIKYSLPTLTYALKNSHFPESETALKNSLRRLAFDEMMILGLGISLRAHNKKAREGIRLKPCSLTPILEQLPYELTSAQKRAVNDIYRDTVSQSDDKCIYPMSRILVGDVGCGKTICAVLAMYICISSGYQTALMVPTEILAKQHYAEISSLFEKLGIKVALLVGSVSKEKDAIYASLENGEIMALVGTHALISDKVQFKNLALTITDEQHRFGVLQRAKLKEKSKDSHLLVMSATPIPRSLALTMYGDLDISTITDMPKGRQKVDTYIVNEGLRERLDAFILKQIKQGGQCYIVCPAIENASDDIDTMYVENISTLAMTNTLDLKNVHDYANSLKEKFPDIDIGTLYGSMNVHEKEDVMSRFVSGEIKILVSTTVIEVGVNVPNATLMIVENAERFGLSQLHQLRGRVGRGSKKSYCILVSDIKNEKTRERLNAMTETNNGFEIAERDLAIRGPGDFFNSNTDNIFRQSGGFEMRFASMCNDTNLYSAAFSAAKSIIEEDPKLELPIHAEIKKIIQEKIDSSASTIS